MGNNPVYEAARRFPLYNPLNTEFSVNLDLGTKEEYEKRKEAGLSDFAASEKRAKPAARSQKLPEDLLETGTPSDVLKAAANIVIGGNKKAEYKKYSI